MSKRKTTRINVRTIQEIKELLERITTRENISQGNLIEYLIRGYEDKGSRFIPILRKVLEDK